MLKKAFRLSGWVLSAVLLGPLFTVWIWRFGKDPANQGVDFKL
jgi:hypothetical protein